MRRREDGFTLIELLVGMSVGMVVLLAILGTLDRFSSNTVHQTKVTDANDQVRTLTERMVADLRGAANITHGTATDLIYTVNEPAGLRTERVCVSGDRLYSFSSVAPAPAAGAGTPCSTGKEMASVKTTSATAFSYDGATSASAPQNVRNVGIQLGLVAGSADRSHTTMLRASSTRRTGTMLLDEDDLDSSCPASGGALLKLDVGIPGVSSLTVSYADENGVALGSAIGTGAVQLTAGAHAVVATITDALGQSAIIRKTVTCG